MRRAAALACMALLVAGGAAYGHHAHRVRHDGTSPRAVTPLPVFLHPVPASGPYATPLVEDVLLGEVREAIETAYYREVPPEILAQPTIQGILGALDDPHTAYLAPGTYEQLQERLDRRYSGVGLTVSPAEGGLEVTSSLHGPARDAGIRPGDVIVSIDGRRTDLLDFERAMALIQGDAGTVVNLRIRRPGAQKPIGFSVVRSTVALPVVRTRLIRTAGHRIGYLRLFSFSTDASIKAEEALGRLREAGAEAILLDLRGNPGGLLNEAIGLTSLFLSKGTVCSIEGVHQARRTIPVTGRAVEPDLPLVVLVDEHSASAAEVVAAALRDNERARVVGIRTYGKATVQSLYPLSNGAALRLTTASYVTPAGESIGGSGLAPELEVADDPLTRPDEAVVAAERVLLEGH